MEQVFGGKEIVNGLQYLYDNGNKEYSEFSIGRKNIIAVFSPELIHELFVNKNEDFVRGITFFNMKKAFRTGILVSDDPEHFYKKRTMKPAFYKDNINSSCSIVYKTVKEILEKNESSEINISDFSRKTSFHSVSKSFFGKRFPEDHIRILMDSTEKVINTKISNLSGEDLSELEVIRKYAEDIVENNKEKNIIKLMIDSEMAKEEIVDQIITLLGAGFDTTSDLIIWSICYLSKNKDILDKIKAENVRWIQEQRSPTIDELSSLKMINKIIKETLRIKSPGYLTSRISKRDTNLLNLKIPSGTHVFVSPYITHNIEKYYKNPKIWNPERWDENFEKNLPRGAYLPFIFGRGRCIGDQFGLMVASIFILMFVNTYNFEIAEDFPEEKFLISLSPEKDVKIKVSSML